MVWLLFVLKYSVALNSIKYVLFLGGDTDRRTVHLRSILSMAQPEQLILLIYNSICILWAIYISILILSFIQSNWGSKFILGSATNLSTWRYFCRPIHFYQEICIDLCSTLFWIFICVFLCHKNSDVFFRDKKKTK